MSKLIDKIFRLIDKIFRLVPSGEKRRILRAELIETLDQYWIETRKAAIEEEREACMGIVKKEIEQWDRESIVELRESILHEIGVCARSS